MNEIRFKQIAVTYGDIRLLYGLTQDGRVFYYDHSDYQIDWKPLGMRVEKVVIEVVKEK